MNYKTMVKLRKALEIGVFNIYKFPQYFEARGFAPGKFVQHSFRFVKKRWNQLKEHEKYIILLAKPKRRDSIYDWEEGA